MRRGIVRKAVSRLLLLGGWFVCIGLLAGLLVEAIHRGHLAGMLIVGTGLGRTGRRPRTQFPSQPAVKGCLWAPVERTDLRETRDAARPLS